MGQRSEWRSLKIDFQALLLNCSQQHSAIAVKQLNGF